MNRTGVHTTVNGEVLVYRNCPICRKWHVMSKREYDNYIALVESMKVEAELDRYES